MGKTTSAERMRKLRSKLKEDEEKYERFKEKERNRDKNRRIKMKAERSATKYLQLEYRRKEAERKRMYRQKIKSSQQTTSTSTSELGSFKVPQSLGKAVKRVKRVLPFSPRKKTAVLKKLVCETFPSLARTLFSESNKAIDKRSISEDIITKVKDFYNTDDISRQAPGIKDYKSIKDPATGERRKVQKRHMNMTVKEAFALFKEENPTLRIKSSKFYELRPENIKLSREMPHQVCVCKYHANFNFLIESIKKKDDNFPSDHSQLLKSVCCDLDNENCMTDNCRKCVVNLHSLISENIDQSIELFWKQWMDNEFNRPRIVEKKGTLSEAVEELQNQLTYFKKHYFVKRVQANTFKDMKSSVQDGEILLQIDYAENYLATSQDEIQSAHWSHKQISVFTACAWTKNQGVLSYAIVSDETSHTKYSVYACLKLLFEDLKNKLPDLETVKLFSDGCAGQFKNRYTLSNLCYMLKDFGLKGEWFFFATSHGKGAVDGIGGATKRAVWNEVKLRKAIIESAKDFIACAKKIITKINFILLETSDIEENRALLDKRWKLVNKIPAIQSKHYFLGYDSRNLICGRTFLKSTLTKVSVIKPRQSVYSEIYSSSDDEERTSDQVNDEERTSDQVNDAMDKLEPAVSLIKPGTFLLVEFGLIRGSKVNKYRHVAISEGGVEDDGEIKIMCLKNVGDTGKTFKVDQKDVSYVQFDQIKGILPQPKLKFIRNNIAFYEFKKSVDIFESG